MLQKLCLPVHWIFINITWTNYRASHDVAPDSRSAEELSGGVIIIQIRKLTTNHKSYQILNMDKRIMILYRGNRDFPLFKMIQSLWFENICSPHSKNFLLHFIKSHFPFYPTDQTYYVYAQVTNLTVS